MPRWEENDPMIIVGRGAAEAREEAKKEPLWFDAWEALRYIRNGRRVTKKGWRGASVWLDNRSNLVIGDAGAEPVDLIYCDTTKKHWKLVNE